MQPQPHLPLCTFDKEEAYMKGFWKKYFSETFAFFFTDCAGLEFMEEHLGENYEVMINDVKMESEQGLDTVDIG